MLAREDEALVGHVVGDRYRVRAVMGRGTTGTVFAVDHIALGRPFAMKVVRPRHAPMELVTKVFQTDTPPAFRLTHPSLCQVIDVGTSLDGAPYFVTELLEGETLAAHLERQRLSVASAVDITIQLLSVMGHAHEHGLLLRDPRPQNLFLADFRGCRALLKVLDFGLTRLLPADRREASWRGPELFTAAHYFSPERARGEFGSDPSSDLFVAATILYEALSGTRPFTATTFGALVEEIVSGTHVPLLELRRDVPRTLSDVVSRALDPDPEARFESADEMQAELRASLDMSSSLMRQASQTRVPVSAVPRINETDEDEDEDDASTAAGRVDPAILDEASAYNTDRTVPPPPSIRESAIPDLTDRRTSGDEETRRRDIAAIVTPRPLAGKSIPRPGKK